MAEKFEREKVETGTGKRVAGKYSASDLDDHGGPDDVLAGLDLDDADVLLVDVQQIRQGVSWEEKDNLM